MKRWLYILCAAILVWSTVEYIVPSALLTLSAPVDLSGEADQEMSYFPNQYEPSRARFLGYRQKLINAGYQAEVFSYPIDEKASLYIDVLQINPAKQKENLLVFTSGVHGVEGFVGSAMMEAFVQEQLGSLNRDNTGVMLVHAVNPWGMKNKRRYNENNVDLNRNFVMDWKALNHLQNQEYLVWDHFLQPQRQLGNSTLHELGFHVGLAYNLLDAGSESLRKALLSGQYSNPQGVYFGGDGDELSTKYMKNILLSMLNDTYQNIVHIDLHTGYGPRYQMSIFSSGSETLKEDEAIKAFGYPLVYTPDSEEYYTTSGDMTEYLYQLQTKRFPQKKLYSTTFEFGTLGDGTVASVDSVKYTVDENRLYWHGTSDKRTEQIVKNRYLEMFDPAEREWRVKALEDFRLALKGVLTYRGVVGK
ncbi:M14 family metallopeptidase [Brevibacillus dissolubilis]|uniref:M14 family metallopeptidase n=1 Tax=Brevibacillus dissolubilis TaxID=1844116 RepID=UPI0011164004|nr:M14 family metallopeptidase [Brevibacillus dissolubilis]